MNHYFKLKIWQRNNVVKLLDIKTGVLFPHGPHAPYSPHARPTTISLTPRQQIAFQELQVKRQKEGERKPSLTEVMCEGLELVLKGAEWPEAELEESFPKRYNRQMRFG